MATLKMAGGSIEVSLARVARQAERMWKLSEPRRANRLEKAKAALAAAGAEGGKAKGRGGKGKRGKGKAKAKAGKGREVSPVARRAAAIVLSQGVTEV